MSNEEVLKKVEGKRCLAYVTSKRRERGFDTLSGEKGF